MIIWSIYVHGICISYVNRQWNIVTSDSSINLTITSSIVYRPLCFELSKKYCDKIDAINNLWKMKTPFKNHCLHVEEVLINRYFASHKLNSCQASSNNRISNLSFLSSASWNNWPHIFFLRYFARAMWFGLSSFSRIQLNASNSNP